MEVTLKNSTHGTTHTVDLGEAGIRTFSAQERVEIASILCDGEGCCSGHKGMGSMGLVGDQEVIIEDGWTRTVLMIEEVLEEDVDDDDDEDVTYHVVVDVGRDSSQVVVAESDEPRQYNICNPSETIIGSYNNVEESEAALTAYQAES